MAFDTPITLTGPPRAPQQMLAEQSYGGHSSIHDGDTADSLGLTGAPIEGPTHFSLFDPLAVSAWGQAWFERGCISAHFKTMVVEGEQTTAALTPTSTTAARIDATKDDGSPVLTGTASIGRDDETELDARLARAGDPGELFIVDQLEIGQRSTPPARTSLAMDDDNGQLYPFSLAAKLGAITESTPWYSSGDNPWGRPIIPFEMVSVMTQKVGVEFAVRGPALGLFLDLEVRMIDGPLFVDHDYLLEREVVGVGQSRRTESYWVRTSVTDANDGTEVASVLLHSGVFKESYAGYPADRL